MVKVNIIDSVISFGDRTVTRISVGNKNYSVVSLYLSVKTKKIWIDMNSNAVTYKLCVYVAVILNSLINTRRSAFRILLQSTRSVKMVSTDFKSVWNYGLNLLGFRFAVRNRKYSGRIFRFNILYKVKNVLSQELKPRPSPNRKRRQLSADSPSYLQDPSTDLTLCRNQT